MVAQFEIFVASLKFLVAFLLMCVNDSDNVGGGGCFFVVFL